MRILLVMIALAMLSFGCTKNNTMSSKTNKLPYDSAIPYVYKKLENSENAAMVDKIPVSWSQLRSQDPALDELEEKYNSKAVAFAYAYALMSLEQKKLQDATVSVSFLGTKPTETLKDIISSNGLEMNKAIEFNFTPVINGDLATIEGKTLTHSDFVKSNLAYSKLYKKIYTQRMQRLNGIVIRRYILQASKDAKLNMEEYVKQKILGPTTKSTEEDVMEFAQRRGISEGDLDEKMIERLKDIVDQEKRDEKLENFVAKKLIKEPVQVSFMAPQINVNAPVLSENIPQWGEGKDPSLLFVGHWNCTDCGSPLKSFLEAKEKWGKKLNGAFIYSFPEQDRESRMGAEAGLCIFNQSHNYFWTFMSKIMNLPAEDNLEESINSAAKSTGADYEKFRQCFLKREFQDVVDTHLAYAKEMGVFKAPLMVMDGHVLEPPIDSKTISDAMNNMGMSGNSKSFFAKIKNFFSNLF